MGLGDFVYDANSKLGGPNRVRKILKTDMSVVISSAPTTSAIRCITEDKRYIYYSGGETDNRVHKLRKSDMASLASSDPYSANPAAQVFALAVDEEHVYCGGTDTNKVWKLRKSDLGKVAESPLLAHYICKGMAVDDHFVYCGTLSGANTIYKLNKSDLTIVTSGLYETWLYYVTIHRDFVYAAGLWQVRKYRKSDLGQVAASPDMGSLGAAAIDDYFVFTTGTSFNVNRKVIKLNKSDLSLVGSGTAYDAAAMQWLCLDKDFVYFGGDEGVTRKVRKSDLVTVGQAPDPGGSIDCGTAEWRYNRGAFFLVMEGT